MRRRAMLFLVALCLGVPAGAVPAGGDAPYRVGWWTVANLGIPQLVAFAPRVPPDNVPDGGFEVGGTVDAPTSYAALLFDVPEGASVGQLELALAEGATPAAEPATAVQACSLTGTASFKTDDGGPMDAAPPFDCERAAVGELAADGLGFTFDVDDLVSDRALAIAIVPVESAPLVFAPPGDDALDVRGSSGVAPLTPSLGSSTPTTRPSSTPFVVPEPPTFAVDAPPLAAPAVERPSDAPSSVAAPISNVSPLPPPPGLGAGSAVVGCLLVVVLGALVARRSRSALDAHLASDT